MTATGFRWFLKPFVRDNGKCRKHSHSQDFKIWGFFLTLPMLRLLSFKAQGCKDFWKSLKPCHVGIHWKALSEYSQMSTYVPRFPSFSGFLHHFVLAKWATSSIRVNTTGLLLLYYQELLLTVWCFPIQDRVRVSLARESQLYNFNLEKLWWGVYTTSNNVILAVHNERPGGTHRNN